MSLKQKGYIPRLIDKKIENYLKVFGAISVEGPKWCGKTWSSLNHAESVVYLDNEETKRQTELSVEYVFKGDKPILIDEWSIVPKTWDAVRRKCDETTEKGEYILTCSTKLSDDSKKKKIHHSGAGRIGKVVMHTMSLFESGDSTGNASIMDMYNGTLKEGRNEGITLEKLAELIIRGGWPANIHTEKEYIGLLPKSYIDAVLDHDMNDDKKRNRDKMNMLLKSLARNESTTVSNQKILSDITSASNQNEIMENRRTLNDYLDVLKRLHIINNQNSFSENYRSRDRVGKAPKRHFTDPSLACACLDMTVEMLLNDLNTFGFLFESLVERDLKVYMDYLDGQLYHFRDNVTGLEVDSILEFKDGEYAAIEIKLGLDSFDTAKKALLDFKSKTIKEPKFMCVIVGFGEVIAKDSETGIYVVPITALKP